jgi:hypothetical protein
MNKFNIGDKVTIKNLVSVYEVTRITRDLRYVLESDEVQTEIYSASSLKL